MSVVRVKRHRERFTVLSTATLRMAALSYKARGLWAHCMSYPDDWEFRTKHLQAQSARDGRDAVQSALRELEAVGLAALETLRGDDGRVRGKRWTIYEEAALNPSVSEDGSEGSGSRAEPTVPTSGVPEAEAVGGDGAALPPRSGTDERETRLSVSEGAHRRTGLPSDGESENRENRRPGNPPLRKKEQHERTSPRKKEQQQARAHASNGVVPLRAVVGDAAVALKEGFGGDAEDASSAKETAVLLVRRGVERSVAEDLAQAHGAEAVRRTVQEYDARRRGPRPPSSPGWLVSALRHGYVTGAQPSASPLLSYPEMLRWCEANGGLHRTADFESVPQPGGKPLFRRRSSPLPSSPPSAGTPPAQTR